MKKTLMILLSVSIVAVMAAWAAVPSTLNDFFLPGSQPGQSGNLEHPGKCDNCHGGYDETVEPAFNWRGSMMAQAARDPLYLACMAISNQDVPESGDLCIRCHAPDGWLNGRSTPTDGSALNNNDREGVQCDFCHKLIKPTGLGINPYPDDPDYTASTYEADQGYLGTLSDIPPASANGMFICDSDNSKRGPFVDAAARHQMYYSPFHKDAALCGTCHDVSNPAFSKAPDGKYVPNDFDAPAPNFDPYSLFPVERTYSEWMMSEYNSPTGVLAPQFGGNKQYVSTCQDCHMRDVSGYGCNKKGAPYRDDLPLHDMTGGNTFMPALVAALYPDEINQAALDAGVARATSMLQKAATLDLNVIEPSPGAGYLAGVKVTNETGHKLPSGYPEGRRIWLNVKALDESGTVIYESGRYDFATADLIHDADIKVYEIKPGISAELSSTLGLPAGPSFHFVLNHEIFSDNRIPPRGFTNANFEMIQSPPVAYSYEDGQYWDSTAYPIPAEAARVDVILYYQTTTKEYVTFLRDENVTNDWGQILFDLWSTNGKSAPVVMNTASFDIKPIVNQPPTADFVASPITGTAPLTVNFSDLSTNGPTSWTWDFGDATGSTEQNPTHVYSSAGVYTVALTATNAYGSDTKTMTGYITVTDGGGVFMHVVDILVSREAGNGGRVNGVATIAIVDQDGSPVADATVTGDFSGPSSGTKSGVTDAAGSVILKSKPTKNPAGEWCFAVTDVAKTGATYDAGANVVTQACESGPLAAAIFDPADDDAFGLTNQPNPFNPATQIGFTLPTTSYVRLEVFNVLGQKIETLVDGHLGAGRQNFSWDGSNVASGIYLYRLIVNQEIHTRKMLLQK